MANETKNYKFTKPGEDDFYDIEEYNKAMDILDETLTGMDSKKLDKNGDASEAITEFNQQILRENLISGEKLSDSLGKVKKWFSELKNVAFSGLASDVVQDAAHRFVSDTEKNSWNNKVSLSGGDISNTKIDTLESITSEFPVPAEGETQTVFLGKVKKFIQDFNDFKSGIITIGKLVNNGQATTAGYALDARYGKTLYDLYTQLNADIGVIGALTYNTIANVTAANGNSTKLYSLALNPGTWLIESQVIWIPNATGRREHTVRQGGAWNSILLAGNTHPADPTADTYQNCTALVKLAEATEISVWGVQTSGGGLRFGGTVKALRLK